MVKADAAPPPPNVDGLNPDGLVAHILDDVFHGIALALLAVEIERGALDQLDQAAAAEDFLLHLLQALLHLHVDHGAAPGGRKSAAG